MRKNKIRSFPNLVLFAFAPSSTTIAATASAAFLAIPGELDVALRDELERIDYGL